MSTRFTVTRAELEERYPQADLEGFVPTHRVHVIDARSRRTLREDVVSLDQASDGGVRFAFVPGVEAPVYGVIPSGKWQCLERHGLVREQPVRYVPDYVAPLDRDGFVYFVQSGEAGPVKIGWSQDVDRRMAELQTANARPLRLIGKIPGRMRDESRVHERFAHLRMEAEWFQNSPEIHEFLARRALAPL